MSGLGDLQDLCHPDEIARLRETPPMMRGFVSLPVRPGERS
jgi:hypothetical protein